VFDDLHRRGTVREAMLYGFDFLELDGEDLRPLPLGDRKKRLAKLLGRRRVGIVFSEHTDQDGALRFMHACRMGLEGIVQIILRGTEGVNVAGRNRARLLSSVRWPRTERPGRAKGYFASDGVTCVTGCTRLEAKRTNTIKYLGRSYAASLFIIWTTMTRVRFGDEYQSWQKQI
jgi:hypothetical protein